DSCYTCVQDSPTYIFFFYLDGVVLALHSFPTRRSSDLVGGRLQQGPAPGCQGGGARDQHQAGSTGGAGLRHAATEPGRNSSGARSEEHTSELQSRENLVCRLLLEKKKCKRQIQKTKTKS